MTRNLVICTDGTWNRPDQRDRDRIVPSNVVKTARALCGMTECGIRQYVYYDTGVGTGGWWDHFKGGVFGIGLLENIKQAYSVIGSTFEVGDNLFLFGFSRGAYTARSLSGLIGLCGVPDPRKSSVTEAVDSAIDIYRMRHATQQKNAERDKRAKEHAEKFAHLGEDGDVLRDVHFVGVWDTVGALGIPFEHLKWIGANRHSFHDVFLGRYIKHAYHAMAIDEKRKPFKPSLWSSNNVQPHQKVEQAWFSGVHSNVGGGYVDRGLSDRALLWMCSKAKDAGLGFQRDYMKRRIDPNLYGELRDSMSCLYKALGPAIRPICVGGVAGEQIHYSAAQRFEFVTEMNYRQSPDRESLRAALELEHPPIAGPTAEEDFHSPDVSPTWNDGGGSPEVLRRLDD